MQFFLTVFIVAIEGKTTCDCGSMHQAEGCVISKYLKFQSAKSICIFVYKVFMCINIS